MTDRGYAGAVVAIDPATGAILAMVSTPCFDPNPLASHSDAVQRRGVQRPGQRRPEPAAEPGDRRRLPAGLDVQVVIAAAALQQRLHPQTPGHRRPQITLPDTGGATLSELRRRDLRRGGGDDVTADEALATRATPPSPSSALSSARMRSSRQARGARHRRRPTSDIGARRRRRPRLGRRSRTTAALAQSCIGQRDVAVTPLQRALITATIANGGDQMRRTWSRKTTKPDLTVISETQPEVAGPGDPDAGRRRAARHDDRVGAGDRRGTGGIADLVIASKTGTAEHGTDPKNTPPHGWFIGFAPADDAGRGRGVGGERRRPGPGRHRREVAGPIGPPVIAAALAGGP